MNNSLFVCSLEGFRDLSGKGQRFVDGNRPLRDAIGQRGPFDELEDQGRDAIGLFKPVNRADVGIVDRREHLRLSAETCHALGVVGERLGQDFQRDVAAKLGVFRSIDLTHPASAERRDDFIRADASPEG